MLRARRAASVTRLNLESTRESSPSIGGLNLDQYEQRALAIARSVAADPIYADRVGAEDRSGIGAGTSRGGAGTHRGAVRRGHR